MVRHTAHGRALGRVLDIAVARRERKVELAYEGQHYWDLLRWRLAHERLNDYQCHAFRIVGDEFNYESCDLKDRKFDQKCYCLPIPTQELRENNLINEQFPEWR